MSEDKESKGPTDQPGKETPRPEEKKPQPEEKKPQAPAEPGAWFRLFAKGWAVAMAAALGATGYGTYVWLGFLAKDLGGVRMSILPAVALGALALWVLLVKMKKAHELAKPGQGTWVRATGYITAVVLGAFGGVQLARLPSDAQGWWRELAHVTILGNDIIPRLSWFPGLAFGLLFVTAYHLWANQPKWSDFLIETQSELRKVSWPPTKEWVMSSAVVVVVVMLVSFFLFGVDRALSAILQKVGIGF